MSQQRIEVDLLGPESLTADTGDDTLVSDTGVNATNEPAPVVSEGEMSTERLPVPVRPAGAWWAWFGLHGGAGVSTLIQAAPGGVDLGGLPIDHGYGGLPVVAVCRSSAAGLSRAQEWAGWAAQHADAANVLGLVVVADAPGRLPRPLARQVQLITGGYRHTWRCSWCPAWRLGAPPHPDNVPASYRRLFFDLASLTEVPIHHQGGTR